MATGVLVIDDDKHRLRHVGHPTSLKGTRSAELLHQVDVVVAVRIARRTTAFAIAKPGVETRRLEGMGVQGHPVAAAAQDLGLGRGEEPGSQASTALVVPHPEQVDVAAPAPRPPVEPRAEVTIVPTHSHAQHAAVMVAGGGGVEGVDLLVEAFGEAGIGFADNERGLAHHRCPSTGTYSRIRPRSRKPTAAYTRSSISVDCRLAVRQPRSRASCTCAAVSAVPSPRRRAFSTVPTL